MTAEPKADSKYAERNRRTGEERRRKTRARLIEAAIKVISERGVEGPVVDDFIAAAEVSRGSYYNYFTTKEELLEAVADHLRAEMMRTDEAVLKLIEDPAERLMWSVRRIIRYARSDHQLGMLLISESRRIMPFDLVIRRAPTRDLRACISQRRLPRQNVELAVDFLVGATREAARAVISLPRSRDHAEQTAVLILKGLGMASEEAQEVAHRPLLDLAMRSEPEQG